jgi:hypothetical protein
MICVGCKVCRWLCYKAPSNVLIFERHTDPWRYVYAVQTWAVLIAQLFLRMPRVLAWSLEPSCLLLCFRVHIKYVCCMPAWTIGALERCVSHGFDVSNTHCVYTGQMHVSFVSLVTNLEMPITASVLVKYMPFALRLCWWLSGVSLRLILFYSLVIVFAFNKLLIPWSPLLRLINYQKSTTLSYAFSLPNYICYHDRDRDCDIADGLIVTNVSC